MLIAEIEKNSLERIRVQVTEYRGHRFIDCRVHYQGANGEWLPTKKGIALSGELAEEVAQAIHAAKNQLESGD